MIVKTLESTPKDATHWSTRSMAAEVGLNQTAVHRIWKAFGLQPHRQDAWKLSKDPQFIEKVRDVVGLYLNPPERAVVLCVDEKSQTRRRRSIGPRRSCRCFHAARAQRRHARLQSADGTSSLYAALDIERSGKVIGRLHSAPTATIEFKQFLATIDLLRGPSRTRRARRARHSSTHNDAGDPEMRCSRTLASPCTSPTDLRRAGSALVERWFSRTDHQESAPRRTPLRARPQRRHPRLDRDLERRSQTAYDLDQDRRPGSST